MDANILEDARPAKRARIDHLDGASDHQDTPMNDSLPAPVAGGGETSIVSTHPDDEQIHKEAKAGITSYIRPDDSGFSGILKQR